MIRIACYNVENLFARPKAFDAQIDEENPVLKAYKEIHELFKKPTYSDADKESITALMLELDLYKINEHGAVRRKRSYNPKWAWFRKNRGTFDREPKDETQSVQIVANGRSSWNGWVELNVEPTKIKSVQMTAKVIEDIDADIIGVVEAENRPSLVKFNEEMLDNLYGHVMLVDGNDDRGIDVGIMTKSPLSIQSIVSNVDATDSEGEVFSRDCPQYEVVTPNGTHIHVLVNHFKSQSGGGGPKRKRQSVKVRQIVDQLVAEGKHVVVMGDLNEGPGADYDTAYNLLPLYQNNSPLVECYTLDNFDMGGKEGTYGSCGKGNRLDYIFISESLVDKFHSGGIFRKGLWGSRKSRPDAWETYEEMEHGHDQASDHACVYVDLDV